MKWFLFAVASVVLLAFLVVAVIAAIGATLPRNHVASRTLRLRRPPQDVWPVVTKLADASGVPVDVLESQPPNRLVTRVKDTEKNFGGTWTMTIAAEGSGSALTITEDGWVSNVIFRFVSRYGMGHHATMDGLLRNVAKELGEAPQLSGE